jgi:PHP family Zn ribbon phosphoesterase
MNEPTDSIYNTTAFGQCRRDFPERPMNFNHVECLICGDIPVAKAWTELFALADEVKNK